MQLDNLEGNGGLFGAAKVPSAARHNAPKRLTRVITSRGIECAFFAPQLAPPPPRRRGAKRLGIMYERRCQEELSDTFGDRYVPSPFLRYSLCGSAAHFYSCIPDGLLFDWCLRQVVIVEMKLRYSSHTDLQIMSVYHPVIERLFPAFTTRALVLCKYFDPATTSYYNVELTESVAEFERGTLSYGLARRVV